MESRKLLVSTEVVGAVHSLAFGPGDAGIAAGSRDGTLRIFDATTLGLRHRHEAGVPLRGVAFSPDGARLAAAAEDMTVRLWEAQSGREIVVLHGHRFPVLSVAWSPDGSRLASGDGADEDPQSVVRLWETR